MLIPELEVRLPDDIGHYFDRSPSLHQRMEIVLQRQLIHVHKAAYMFVRAFVNVGICDGCPRERDRPIRIVPDREYGAPDACLRRRRSLSNMHA